MRHLPSAVLAVLAAALALTPAARSQDSPGDTPDSVAASAATSETLWFVELTGDKAAFRSAAAAAGIRFTERFSYDQLWNGVSVSASPSHAAAMTRLNGVTAVYQVDTVELQQFDDTSNPQLLSALAMSGADVVQAAGFDGTGIRVGVIDSGIDYDHPDLGGCFGPGCRVETGFDFVGDAFTGGNTPIPDANPDDCPGPAFTNPALPQAGGHGTHVAGIVGASGNPATAGARGAAPGVTFGAYRVFGCSGSTTADIMLAAMERAFADGMDVVNMSIGSSFQWPQYPTAVAADALVDRGVVVITSFGNSGATGLYSGSAPGVGERVIAVGAVNNTHQNVNFFTVTPDNGAVPYNQATAAPPAPTSGSFLMARTGTPATTNDACNANPPAAGSLTGRVALIQRGTCSFHEKSLNAQLAGAAGVVIYNNVAGLQSITVAGTPSITIPVVSITRAAGLVVDGRIAAGPVTMTWQDGLVSVPATGGNTSASFSSYGLSPDLQVKPDLTAPGGGIRSTYPLGFGSGYAVLSGTSMASPHVAGNVAQMLQADPDLTPDQIRVRLQNSASPILWWGNPGLGFLDQVQRQGAGHVRVDRALAVTSGVTPTRIAIGETAGDMKFKLTVRNDGTEEVTYTVHHEPALSTGPNTFTVGAFTGFAGAAFSTDSVTVAPGGRADVHVTFTPNAGLPDNSLYGGFVVFTPDDGGPVLRVPYAGFKGDYQSLPVLAPASAFDFPWLAQLVGPSFFNRPNGASYTMVGNDVPFFLVHLAHQSRNLEMTVRAVGSNSANWHGFVDVDYVRRNGGNNPAALQDSFFSFAWDGFTLNPSGRQLFEVPDGDYQVTIRARKALGTPADDDVWVSPVITIDRP